MYTAEMQASHIKEHYAGTKLFMGENTFVRPAAKQVGVCTVH